MQVDGPVLTLARRHPVRWDVSAETRLPDGNRAAIAHQVRQDLWRALRSVRGFAPVVQVTRDGQGLVVRAGGQLAGRAAPGLAVRVADLLEAPALRARWVAHA